MRPCALLPVSTSGSDTESVTKLAVELQFTGDAALPCVPSKVVPL